MGKTRHMAAVSFSLRRRCCTRHARKDKMIRQKMKMDNLMIDWKRLYIHGGGAVYVHIGTREEGNPERNTPRHLMAFTRPWTILPSASNTHANAHITKQKGKAKQEAGSSCQDHFIGDGCPT